jgi:hypothetical protein
MNDVPLSPRLAWPLAACVCIVLMLACSGCFSAFPTSLTGTSGAQPLVTSGSYSPPAAYDTTAASSGGSCRQGLTSCGGNCVDTGVDIGNCGRCGMACPSNSACRNSQCYCKDGYEWSAADSACVKSTAPAAEVTGSQEQSGGYVCEDPSLTACGKLCYDLTADPVNCGTCGNACANGEQCTGGQCGGGTSPAPGGNSACSVTFATISPEVNAEIWLDNSDTGYTTPHTLPVKSGSHTYTFKKAGYVDFSYTFQVTTPAAGGYCGQVEATTMEQVTQNPSPKSFAVKTTYARVYIKTTTVPANAPWTGTWSMSVTKTGPITMNQNGNSVLGTYTNSLGQTGCTISGVDSTDDVGQHSLSGTWHEGTGSGPFYFRMDATQNAFYGWWGLNPSDLMSRKTSLPNGNWNGQRQ